MEGIKDAREQFAELLAEDEGSAVIHYEIAFANVQMIHARNGNGPATGRLLEDAAGHLLRAIDIDDSLVDAYALFGWLEFYTTEIDSTLMKYVRAKSQGKLAAARRADPTNPRALLAEAIPKYFNQTTVNDAYRLNQLAVAHLVARKSATDTLPDWWLPTAYYWLATSHLFRPKPMYDSVRHYTLEALRAEGQYEMAQANLLPTIDKHEPLPVQRFQRMHWERLAQDDRNDLLNKSLPDARQLSYSYDAVTDTLWFRIDLHNAPNPASFGVNIAVDDDADSVNGARWWGFNNDFHFDKLATCWLSDAGNGTYFGRIGIATADQVLTGRFMKRWPNSIVFAVDAETNALIIGLKRSELTRSGSFRLIAATGSHAGWADDIPNRGAAGLVLKRE
ncbi:MAG TPA: hypothetical protein VGB22_07330 [candidate division Zixibacteria bacterium]|jgi:hypothetical protein